MAETLLHYAGQLVTLEPRVYQQEAGFKPAGFWVSDGEAWKEWCEGEQWGLDRIPVCHEVRLADLANILRLNGPQDIDQFTAQFCIDHHQIDWVKVAALYQGIFIMPYCWSRRMNRHTFWYYPWDCSSGCIWDLTAIASVHFRPAGTEVVQ